MDKIFIKLFTEVVHATEVLSEKVMEYDKEQGQLQGYDTAKKMREDYAILYDKMREDNFEVNQLNKSDVSKILIGTAIVAQNLENQLQNYKAVIDNYTTNIIPKLTKVIDESKTDEEMIELLEKTFEISEEK